MSPTETGSLIPENYVDPRGLGPASPLAALAGAYLQDLRDKGRARWTVSQYDRYLRELVAFAGADLPVARVDVPLIKAFTSHLARRGSEHAGSRGEALAPQTRNLRLIALRGLLRYGQLLDLAVPAPDKVELARPREFDPDARHIDADRLEQLLGHYDGATPRGLLGRALVETLLASGCRVSEVVALDRAPVEIAARSAGGAEPVEITVLGKGGRHRRVFLTERAWGWLRRYLDARTDADPALFVTGRRDRRGSLRISVRTAQRLVETAARAAGLITATSPHSLRHAAVTAWATRMGLQAAQRLAGHRSIATTNRYLGGSDAELKRLFKERMR